MRSTLFVFALPLVTALPQSQPGTCNNSNRPANVFMYPEKDPDDPAAGLNFPAKFDYGQFQTFSLNLHNQVRAPYNIDNSLGWDPEMAEEAWNWASTCVYQHGMTKDYNMAWGQNIAWNTRPGILQMMARSFYLWFYSESRYYDFQTHEMLPSDEANCLWQAAGGNSMYSPQIGHFENILKRGFGGLGCAVQYCSSLQDTFTGQTHQNVLYSVCNFAQGPDYGSDNDFPSAPTRDVPQIKDAMNF